MRKNSQIKLVRERLQEKKKQPTMIQKHVAKRQQTILIVKSIYLLKYKVSLCNKQLFNQVKLFSCGKILIIAIPNHKIGQEE